MAQEIKDLALSLEWLGLLLWYGFTWPRHFSRTWVWPRKKKKKKEREREVHNLHVNIFCKPLR